MTDNPAGPAGSSAADPRSSGPPDATSYDVWTAADTRRGEDEARQVRRARAGIEQALRRRADGTWDADGDGAADHDEPVEHIEVISRPERVDPERVEVFGPGEHAGPRRARGAAHGRGAMRGSTRGVPPNASHLPPYVVVGGHPRAGAEQDGPGMEGLFGAGTPLGEATGLRLKPRKRWVAAACGLLGGFLGAQSFYTGHLLRGMLQLGAVVSVWFLTLATLGLLLPLAEVVTVAIWLWGAVEGLLYAFARTGPYSRDVLGGRLR